MTTKGDTPTLTLNQSDPSRLVVNLTEKMAETLHPALRTHMNRASERQILNATTPPLATDPAIIAAPEQRQPPLNKSQKTRKKEAELERLKKETSALKRQLALVNELERTGCRQPEAENFSVNNFNSSRLSLDTGLYTHTLHTCSCEPRSPSLASLGVPLTVTKNDGKLDADMQRCSKYNSKKSGRSKSTKDAGTYTINQRIIHTMVYPQQKQKRDQALWDNKRRQRLEKVKAQQQKWRKRQLKKPATPKDGPPIETSMSTVPRYREMEHLRAQEVGIDVNFERLRFANKGV